MEHFSKAKIRFNHCDPMGHLNNAKYIDYMLNAREDHLEEYYNFIREDYTKQTGCTWAIVQNEIAYLKEVKFNQEVVISSKLIYLDEKISKTEIIMRDDQNDKVHAVLWVTFIHFNLKTRKAEPINDELLGTFKKFLVELEQKDFNSRAQFFRLQNK